MSVMGMLRQSLGELNKHGRFVICQIASVHHTAQAMCSEGIAASSFAWEASAPVCQDPIAWVEATTSVNPGSIRGGATG